MLPSPPQLPVFLFKFLFTVWSVDAMYYHFHVWEHRPHVYRWLHKRHHDMKITNVYGFFFVTPLEHHIQAMFGVITNTLLAHTIGQDLFTMCAFTLFGVGTDLHIHSGYAAPFIPFNWWNPQYFHDHHHSQNKGSYGAFFAVPVLSWDWWMGTDQNWRRFRVSGDEVRLHRNTYPGFAVPGDLDKKRTVNDVAEDKDD